LDTRFVKAEPAAAEREIRALLWKHGGEVAACARDAGVHRVAFWRWLKLLNLTDEPARVAAVAKSWFRLKALAERGAP